MYGHMKGRKRAIEVLQFFKYIRSLYPISERLHIIMDNLSSHKTEDVVTWAEENNVELVFTPTNASWLNPIECHFAPLKSFAIMNADHRTKKEQATAVRRYIAWRNRKVKNE